MSDRALFSWLGVGLVAVVLVLILGTRLLVHHYGHTNCYRFGEASSREVRFVDYTFWSWECLTPTADGKWIPTSQLRDIDR